MQAYTVGDLNIVGLIKTHIEQLAAMSRLAKLDKKYKEKYANLFPTDIPHVCNLPTDMYHHIDVKPVVVKNLVGQAENAGIIRKQQS